MAVWPRFMGSAYESSNRRDNSSPDSSNCDRKVFIYLVARYLTFRSTFFFKHKLGVYERGKAPGTSKLWFLMQHFQVVWYFTVHYHMLSHSYTGLLGQVY